MLYTHEDSLVAITHDRLEKEICPSHTFHHPASSLPSNPVSQKSKLKSFHEELNLKITTGWERSYLGSTILYNIKSTLSNRGMLVVSHAAFPEGNSLLKEEFFFYHYTTQSELWCKCITMAQSDTYGARSAAHTPQPAPLSSAEHCPCRNPALGRWVCSDTSEWLHVLLMSTTSWHQINTAWLFPSHTALFQESNQTYLEGYNLSEHSPSYEQASYSFKALSTGSIFYNANIV